MIAGHPAYSSKPRNFQVENCLESDNLAVQGLYLQTPSYNIKISYANDYAEDRNNKCIDMSLIGCNCELRQPMRYMIGVVDGEAWYELGSWQVPMYEKDTAKAQKALDIAVETITYINGLIKEYFEPYSS